MACVFCDIAQGRLPAAVVFRGGGVTAFLDVRPVFKGHVLVIPDRHVETLVDADLPTLGLVIAATQQIARAVLAAGLGAEGTFVANNNKISQSVPHLHVHVVPRRKGDGLKGFFWPRTRYADDAERERYRAALAAGLGTLSAL